MSERGTKLVSRITARLVRGLRAARRPWVVLVGLLYFAGDLWCIAGRNDWYHSMTGRLARAVVFGRQFRTLNYRHQTMIVVLPDSPAERPAVIAPDEQSWGEAARLTEKRGGRVLMVFANAAPTPDHLHARTTTVVDWRVIVVEYNSGRTASDEDRDRAIAAVRDWNTTCEANLGLVPVDVDPKCVTTVHPLGILHNALSLGVLVLTLNALPSVTIGAWLRRRAARRMASGQCVACGYEFGAAAIERCPECGEHRVR
ncbi:MAG: hypothetical protein U0638_10230 [Phycisphaerales bacterium]